MKKKRLDIEVTETQKRYVMTECAKRGVSLKQAILQSLVKNRFISKELAEF